MEDVENVALGHAQLAAAHDHDHRIRHGLASVLLVCAHFSVWHVVLVTATHLSWALALVLLVLSTHVLYLMIYALGYYRYISERTMHELINTLEIMNLGVNLFRYPAPSILRSLVLLIVFDAMKINLGF